jgi:urocanate hydratase
VSYFTGLCTQDPDQGVEKHAVLRYDKGIKMAMQAGLTTPSPQTLGKRAFTSDD